MFLTRRGGRASRSRTCLDAMLPPLSRDSLHTFRSWLTASVESCAEIKGAPSFSGVTSSDRVCSKVHSDARRRLRQETRATLHCASVVHGSAGDAEGWAGGRGRWLGVGGEGVREREKGGGGTVVHSSHEPRVRNTRLPWPRVRRQLKGERVRCLSSCTALTSPNSQRWFTTFLPQGTGRCRKAMLGVCDRQAVLWCSAVYWWH